MKNIKMKYSLILLIVISLLSCNSDDNTGESMLEYTPINIAVNVVDTEVTTTEDAGNEYTITATIDEPSTIDYVIDIIQLSGNDNDNDYEVNPSYITIPAGSTSSTAIVSVISTGADEEDEVFVFGAKARGNADVLPFEFKLNIIDNNINDVLKMSFDWCTDYEFPVTVGNLTGNYCDMIDLDFYIYDSSFNVVANYSAATGSAPETLVFEDLADGTYYVQVFVWENKISDLGIGQQIPIAITYEQDYFIPETTLNHGLYLSTDSPGDPNSQGVSIGVACEVVKNGHEYTITAY